MPTVISQSFFKTRFGGVRDDSILIEVAPLDKEIPLFEFIELTGIHASIDQWNLLIETRAIFITTSDLPHRPKRIHPYKSAAVAVIPSKTIAVRFHLSPQRFPLSERVVWSDRIIATLPSGIIVVQKPAGIPSQPVASNYREAMGPLLSEFLKYEKGLRLLSRLDLWTGGVLCFAKSDEACRAFNKAAQTGELTKIYKALVAAAKTSPLVKADVPCPMVHWMPPGSLFGIPSPRFIRQTEHPGWKRCEAILIDIKKSPKTEIADDCEYKEDLQEAIIMADSNRILLEVTICLITGRTHQLRAQLAALEAPIVNDSLYWPLSGCFVDKIESSHYTDISFIPAVLDKQQLLHAAEESVEKLTESFTDVERHLFMRTLLSYKPDSPIALQCHKLIYEREEYTASAPWWDAGLI